MGTDFGYIAKNKALLEKIAGGGKDEDAKGDMEDPLGDPPVT